MGGLRVTRWSRPGKIKRMMTRSKLCTRASNCHLVQEVVVWNLMPTMAGPRRKGGRTLCLNYGQDANLRKDKIE